MKSTQLSKWFSLAVALVWLAGCQQEEVRTQVSDLEEQQTIETISTNDAEVDDILLTISDAELDVLGHDAGGRGRRFPCAEITWEEETQTLTIDFGEGCVGPRGRIRSGKIVITYNSELGDQLAELTITFEDYFVNKKGIDGTIELRDVYLNDDGFLVYTNRITDLTIYFPKGDSIVYNGVRTREHLDADRQRIKLTGWLSGVSSKGRSFEEEITKPVIIDWSCRDAGFLARVEGTIEITRISGYGERTRTIDYGDGTCDNTITITIDNKTYEVTPGD